MTCLRYLLIVFSLIFSLCLSAQEKQVSVDLENRVMKIDKKLRDKLGIYPQIDGFISARAFQVNDSSFYIEIEYSENNDNYKKKISMSADEFIAWRQEIYNLLNKDAPEVVLNQSGRTYFVLASAITSLGFYGIAIPEIVEPESFRGSLAIYMLTGGSGIFFPLSMTKTREVTIAESRLKGYGQTRGILHGVLLGSTIDDSNFKLQTGLGVLVSLSESFAGSAIARNQNFTPGHVATINALGDYGFGYGLGTSHLTNSIENYTASRYALPLTGSLAGLWVGHAMDKDQIYTRGDAATLRGVGLLAALTGTTIADLAQPENNKVYTSLAILSGTAGIYYGHQLAKKYNFSVTDGIFNNLGILAGGLVGLGFGYITSSDDFRSQYLLSTSTLGAIGGFMVMRKTWQIRDLPRDNAISFDYSINPAGFLSINQKREASGPFNNSGLFYFRMKF